MPDLSPLLTAQDIEYKVAALAERISKDYRDRDLVMVGVLKGVFIFLADLVRKLTIPVTIDFAWYSSYGDSDTSAEKITQVAGIRTDIAGKDVLIVEDILDTGLTIKALKTYLSSFNPESIKVCAFIDKHERRSAGIEADYVGHCVHKGFLVGYGLDYAEQYRYLPAIYELKNIISEDAK
jgi:hypoxanthine phosphoribosyltransferase